MSPRRKKLLAALLSTVLALFIVEKLLGGPLRPDLDAGRDSNWQVETQHMHEALHQADPDLVYVPRPGASVQMDYGLAAFNDQGLREPRPVGPPGDDRRVLVLGDSLVWGELLSQQQALPAALERALDAGSDPGPGSGHEVINLGVTGYDTTQELGWYLRAGRPLQPDVVVLVYCLNDMLLQSGPFQVHVGPDQEAAYDAERAAFDAAAPLRNETVNQIWWTERQGDGSQLLAALRHSWRWHRLFTLPGGYVDEVLLAARDPARVARTRAALASLGDAVRADGATPVLVISPGLYWWHRYQWDEVHAEIRQAGDAAGFLVIDPLDQWRGEDPEPFRFPGDNLHYTAWGTEQLAEIIAAELTAAGVTAAAIPPAPPSTDVARTGPLAGPSTP